MNDRELFDAQLTAPMGKAASAPRPFNEEQEEQSFVGIMSTAMPGRAS